MEIPLKSLILYLRRKHKGQATDGPDKKKSKEENALKVISYKQSCSESGTCYDVDVTAGSSWDDMEDQRCSQQWSQ